MVVLLAVASTHRTEVPVGDVPALLPEGGPASASEVEAWVRRHPEHAVLHGSGVVRPGVGPPSTAETLERRLRGATYLESAAALFNGPLGRAAGLVECVCVTGSTAYQEPARGDDLDFLVVTRDGTTWAFLLYAFLVLRFQRRVACPADAEWCLNYVLDASQARATYGSPQGFLFAREALTARPISGFPYYRSLLLQAPWMRDELPRMFARWAADGPLDPPADQRAPLWARIANAAVFPLLATYLQLVTLYRNHRLRRAQRGDACFKTVTRLGRYAVATEKYRRLTLTYSPATKSGVSDAAV